MDFNASNASAYNLTVPGTCLGGIATNTCVINTEEEVKRDAIAGIRILVSCLSILGSLSIITSVIWRRLVSSPKVHPLFVLSVADCILGLTWVLGGLLWFTRVQHREWCFLPSLLTVIMECVTVNLTLVYALFAYSTIKQKDINSILANMDRLAGEKVWRPSRTFTAYFIAWVLPFILIMCAFGLDAVLYHTAMRATECSCWCLPYFGNVLPLTWEINKASRDYMNNMRTLIASYGVVLGTNYLVVFVLLIVIYYKILRHIKKMRATNEQIRSFNPNYGAVDALIAESQSKARKRVVCFLTVFIITGFFNLSLSYLFAVIEGVHLHSLNYGHNDVKIMDPLKDHLRPGELVFYLLQSVTVPLQGFLNALVYGWTREDFLDAIARRSGQVNGTEGREEEDERSSSLQLSQEHKYSEVSSLLAETSERKKKRDTV